MAITKSRNAKYIMNPCCPKRNMVVINAILMKLIIMAINWQDSDNYPKQIYHNHT